MRLFKEKEVLKKGLLSFWRLIFKRKAIYWVLEEEFWEVFSPDWESEENKRKLNDFFSKEEEGEWEKLFTKRVNFNGEGVIFSSLEGLTLAARQDEEEEESLLYLE